MLNSNILRPSPSIAGVILSRTDSSRLPGKVLIPVEGLPLIGYVIARAKRINGLSSIVLATTSRSVDDQLCEYALQKGVDIFRGDLENVAFRVLNCVKEIKCDYFVRLNGDSPFLDPQLIDKGLLACQDNNVDFVSNIPGRTFPYGISVEIIRTHAFERAYDNISDELEKEHFTTYIYRHPDLFNTLSIQSPRPDLRKAHIVVDDHNDLLRFTKAVKKLGNRVFEAGFEEVATIYLQMSDEESIPTAL